MLRAGNRLRFSPFDFCFRYFQTYQAIVFNDEPGRQSAVLHAEQILVSREPQHLLANLLGFRNLLRRGIVGRLGQRHVLLAAAVNQQAAFDSEFFRLNSVCLASGGDALFKLMHVGLNSARLESPLVILKLKDFHYVDGCQAAADHDRFVGRFISRARCNPPRSCGCTNR